jgi:hypothetical protein
MASYDLRLTDKAIETMRFLTKVIAMRSFLPAVIVATILGSIVIAPAPAKASANLAFCLQLGESTQCDYSTYEQCQASASGISADCIGNPDPRATRSAEPSRPARRASRRR